MKLDKVLKKPVAWWIAKKHRSRTFSLSENWGKSKRLVILLPSDVKPLISALDNLPEIAKALPYTRLYLLYFGENAHIVASRKMSWETIYVTPKDTNWLNLPLRHIVDKIKSQEFDISLDLDYTDNLFNAVCGLLCGCTIRMGFNKDFGQPFYNFQIMTSKENPENSFFYLLQVLQNFNLNPTKK